MPTSPGLAPSATAGNVSGRGRILAFASLVPARALGISRKTA